MAFSVEASHEALHEEACAEGVFWALLAFCNVRNQSHQSDLCIVQLRLLPYRFHGLFNITWRSIFVQVNYLEHLIVVLCEACKLFIQLVIELVN